MLNVLYNDIDHGILGEQVLYVMITVVSLLKLILEIDVKPFEPYITHIGLFSYFKDNHFNS